MEQIHVISILGADARFLSCKDDLSQAVHDLNRKTLRLHSRHVVSWALRGAFILSLFLLGRYGPENAVSGALTWTSGFLFVYLLWFMAKGHLQIQGDRQAKLYWLKNDAANHEYCSNDPIVATMPSQDQAAADKLFGNVVRIHSA